MKIYVVQKEYDLTNENKIMKAFRNIDEAREYAEEISNAEANKSGFISTGLIGDGIDDMIGEDRRSIYLYRDSDETDPEPIVWFNIIEIELA